MFNYNDGKIIPDRMHWRNICFGQNFHFIPLQNPRVVGSAWRTGTILSAERGWVSKILLQGPRPEGAARGLQLFWNTAVAAESFPTEQVCKILSTVWDRKNMDDWTAVCWSNKNVKSYQLCVTEIRWRTEQLSVGVTRMTEGWVTNMCLL